MFGLFNIGSRKHKVTVKYDRRSQTCDLQSLSFLRPEHQQLHRHDGEELNYDKHLKKLLDRGSEKDKEKQSNVMIVLKQRKCISCGTFADGHARECVNKSCTHYYCRQCKKTEMKRGTQIWRCETCRHKMSWYVCVRAWSSRMSLLFHLPIMSLKLQEYHSYCSLKSHENQRSNAHSVMTNT